MIKIVSFMLLSLFVSTNAFAMEKLNVFVSILPQKYFVEQIGQDLVKVHVMVGSGQSPTTYEPTPRQMAEISKAQLYFSIGVPFEQAWLPKIKKNNKQLVFVECCEQFFDLSISNHKHADLEQGTEENDQHIWASPKKVILIVKQIAEQLAKTDNDNAGFYKTSANQFIEKLIALDGEIRTKINKLVKKDLIVSHPSWSYFAKEYGLVQIPVEQGGKEIQANSMTRIIRQAKENNIKAIFIQPQFNNKAAKVIAKEIDAKIISLDPLAYDYIKNMGSVTERIVEGLSYE